MAWGLSAVKWTRIILFQALPPKAGNPHRKQGQEGMKNASLTSRVWVTLIYVLLGSAWIIITDSLVDLFIPKGTSLHSQIQTLKGWFFVAVNALLLFGLMQANERRRQRLEEQYQQVFNSSPDAIFLIDRTGRFLEVNQRVIEYYGYSHADLMVMTVSDLDSPERRHEASNQLHKMFMTGGGDYHWQHRRKDGSALEVEIRARPVEWRGQTCMMNTVIDITDQIRYRRTLEESERRYRTLFQDSPTPLWEEDFRAVKASLDELAAQGVSDLPGYFRQHPQAVSRIVSQVRVLDVNDAVCKLYNTTREELLAGLSEIFDIGSAPAFAEELTRVARGERQFDMEVVLRTLHGEARHTIIHWAAAPGFENSLERVYVAVTDITERKQAEENLRQSNQKLETLIQASPLAIYTLDQEGRVQLWNPAAERMLGWQAKETLGQVLPIVAPYQQNDFQTRLAQVFAGQTLLDLELECRRKDGRPIVLNLTAAPIHEAAGMINLVMSTATDITERKRLQIESDRLIGILKESEQRFRRLVASNIIGVIIYTTNGEMLEANESFLRMTGYTRADLPLNWYQYAWPEWKPQDELPQGEPRNLDTAQPYEKELIHKTGRRVPVLVGAARLDEPDQIIAFVLDLSDIKEKEAQLRASVAEKDVLLREVHHRVKNNLEVIVSLAELQTLKISDPAVLNDIRELQERVRTIALVHENLYRSEHLEQISAQEYLEKLTSFLFISFGSADYELQVQADDVVMNIEKAIPCGLIVNELVTNAFKHAFPANAPEHAWLNPPNRQISIRLSFDGERYHLEVSDNGRGLPADLDPATASSLGLRLVSLLSQQLHGQMQTYYQAGAHFQVTFPQ